MSNTNKPAEQPSSIAVNSVTLDDLKASVRSAFRRNLKNC